MKKDHPLKRSLLPFLVLAPWLAGCGPSSESPPESELLQPSPMVQTAFRVRLDPAVPLNADSDWAGPTNTQARVHADQPFRIRFELEAPTEGPGAEEPHPPISEMAFGLQVRRNGDEWENVLARDFPYPDEISTPRVSIVTPVAWKGGDPAADLLNVSEEPFAGGSGVGLDSVTTAWTSSTDGGSESAPSASGAHGEWEWTVVIRRYADGAVINEEGDVFEFRMTDGVGRPVQGNSVGTVTLQVPHGLLGGTYVETPGVLGPWQSSTGDLYFPMEPAETFNVLMMVKSVDRGGTWREADGANRPATDDLEGFATAFHSGRIHMLHQISEATFLHVFRTSDVVDAPDTWEIRDELVSEHSEPPTQVAALEVLGDGTLVAFYGDSLGLRYRIRDPEGGWGKEGVVDMEPGLVASGIMTTTGPGDSIQLAYTAGNHGERSVWYRNLLPDGTLSPAVKLASGVGLGEEDVGSVAPVVCLEQGGAGDEPGATVVLYRLADGSLNSRRIRVDGSMTSPTRVTERRVVQSGADSEQVGADVVAAGGTVHVLFIDQETRDLWYTWSDAPGEWAAAVPVVEGIDGQWVRGRLLRKGEGALVYGFVYDAGSDGGSGMNYYGEVQLPPG